MTVFTSTMTDTEHRLMTRTQWRTSWSLPPCPMFLIPNITSWDWPPETVSTNGCPFGAARLAMVTLDPAVTVTITLMMTAEHMTHWFSHGRLCVVLVLTQRYVVLLSSSSCGVSTLATVLGTKSGRRLAVFKEMPNICVRHLGLLGLIQSSRLHSSLNPSVITLTLWTVPALCGCSSVHAYLVAVRDLPRSSQHVTPSRPSRVTLRTSVTVRHSSHSPSAKIRMDVVSRLKTWWGMSSLSHTKNSIIRLKTWWGMTATHTLRSDIIS